MEITASRKAPKEQSAKIIYDDKGKEKDKAGSRKKPAAVAPANTKAKKD